MVLLAWLSLLGQHGTILIIEGGRMEGALKVSHIAQNKINIYIGTSLPLLIITLKFNSFKRRYFFKKF